MQVYSFAASNGASTFDVDTAAGAVRIAFTVPGTVTDGTIKVDYKLSGSDRWRAYNYGPPNGGALRVVDANTLDALFFGDVTQIRLTQAGMVGSGTITMVAYDDSQLVFPLQLFTDGGGRNARLRVDDGQTGFFAGREFRTFKELNIANADRWLVKIVVPINIIFTSASFAVDGGSLRVKSFGGAVTTTGTFSETVPVLPKNSMTEVPQPAYTAQVVLTAVPTAGTISGGVQLDVVRLVAAGGQSSTVEAVGGGDDRERGIGAGTYYFLFENIGTGSVTGTFHAHWEERP